MGHMVSVYISPCHSPWKSLAIFKTGITVVALTPDFIRNMLDVAYKTFSAGPGIEWRLNK